METVVYSDSPQGQVLKQGEFSLTRAFSFPGTISLPRPSDLFLYIQSIQWIPASVMVFLQRKLVGLTVKYDKITLLVTLLPRSLPLSLLHSATRDSLVKLIRHLRDISGLVLDEDSIFEIEEALDESSCSHSPSQLKNLRKIHSHLKAYVLSLLTPSLGSLLRLFQLMAIYKEQLDLVNRHYEAYLSCFSEQPTEDPLERTRQKVHQALASFIARLRVYKVARGPSALVKEIDGELRLINELWDIEKFNIERNHGIGPLKDQHLPETNDVARDEPRSIEEVKPNDNDELPEEKEKEMLPSNDPIPSELQIFEAETPSEQPSKPHSKLTRQERIEIQKQQRLIAEKERIKRLTSSILITELNQVLRDRVPGNNNE